MTLFFIRLASIRQDELDVVTFFDFAMEQIMRLGGDTDTNACIVGAAVGAFVTADHLP